MKCLRPLYYLAVMVTILACEKNMDSPASIPHPSTFVFDRVELDLHYFRFENNNFVSIAESDFLMEVPGYEESEIVDLSSESTIDLSFSFTSETAVTFEGLASLDGLEITATYESSDNEILINADADTIFQNPVFRLEYKPSNQELIYEGAVIVSTFEGIGGTFRPLYSFDFVPTKRTLQDLQMEIINNDDIVDGRPVIIGFTKNIFRLE